MKTYTKTDIEKALRKTGLKRGHIVYINPEIYRFGVLKDAENKEQYFKIFNFY